MGSGIRVQVMETNQPRIPAPASAPLANPAAITTTSTTGEVVTYRIRSGQLVGV